MWYWIKVVYANGVEMRFAVSRQNVANLIVATARNYLDGAGESYKNYEVYETNDRHFAISFKNAIYVGLDGKEER